MMYITHMVLRGDHPVKCSTHVITNSLCHANRYVLSKTSNPSPRNASIRPLYVGIIRLMDFLDVHSVCEADQCCKVLCNRQGMLYTL
jgi:hypothetical protein